MATGLKRLALCVPGWISLHFFSQAFPSMKKNGLLYLVVGINKNHQKAQFQPNL